MEERLLSRGWNFCVRNKLTKVDDLKTEMEINALKIEPHCHPSVFQTMCSQLHNHTEKLINKMKNNIIRNISDEEYNAIQTLKNNKNIIISKADKGNAIVVMDTTDYIQKINNILELKQFRPTSKSILKEKENEMNKYLRLLYSNNIITKQLFYNIRSICSSAACAYGQSKIHKDGYPLRPIISAIGSYDYELSEYIANLIKNNIKEKPISYIKNSFDLVKRIKEIRHNNDQIMCSFDVDALYTNVPVNEAINITINN